MRCFLYKGNTQHYKDIMHRGKADCLLLFFRNRAGQKRGANSNTRRAKAGCVERIGIIIHFEGRIISSYRIAEVFRTYGRCRNVAERFSTFYRSLIIALLRFGFIKLLFQKTVTPAL